MKRILLFTFLCVSFLTLESQTITWTGAGDGINWSDLNNWDLSTLPTDSHNVIIPDGSTVTIDEPAHSNSFDVQGSSTITINNPWIINGNSLFSENTIVNWRYGFLGRPMGLTQGNGIITNYGTININRPEPSFDTPTIINISFNNEGVISFLDGSLVVADGGVLNNQSSGIIDLGEVSYGISNAFGWALCCGVVNNYGNIRKTKGVDVVSNQVELNNYGVINAMSGVIRFYDNSFMAYLNNKYNGVIKGFAAIELSESNFTNNGTISPGNSPGILTFIGDFTSSSSSKLAVELNGLNQGVDYDLFEIQGNAVFEGVVEIIMGFEGAINDEFVIAVTTGTITSCNLAPTATAEFNGSNYFFDVTCNNDKQVVLKISNVTLGTDSSEFIENNIQIYPNPTKSQLRLKNNNNLLIENLIILDINGRIIKDINLNTFDKELDIYIPNYSPGLYFIKINSSNNYVIKKIIKM